MFSKNLPKIDFYLAFKASFFFSPGACDIETYGYSIVVTSTSKRKWLYFGWQLLVFKEPRSHEPTSPYLLSSQTDPRKNGGEGNVPVKIFIRWDRPPTPGEAPLSCLQALIWLVDEGGTLMRPQGASRVTRTRNMSERHEEVWRTWRAGENHSSSTPSSSAVQPGGFFLFIDSQALWEHFQPGRWRL